MLNIVWRVRRSRLRLSRTAAVRLRWVVQHATEYNVDTNRIVLTGHSAGGHLSLTTGLLTPEAGLDNQCFGVEPLESCGHHQLVWDLGCG